MNNQLSTHTHSAALCGPQRALRYKLQGGENAEVTQGFAEIENKPKTPFAALSGPQRPLRYKLQGGENAEVTQGFAEKSLKLLTLLLLFIGLPAVIHANNIQIANGRVVQDGVGADRFIEFDLNWENSWRDPINWDAAWVFVKYRVPAANGGDDLWKHVWLSTENGDHQPGSGTSATINIGTTNIGGTDRGMGAFIYRSANGTGTFSTTGTRLRWDVTAQVGHLGFSASAPIEIRVFAIEMVYVAEGAFFVGSGGTESGSFTDGSWTSDATIPLSISSENALTIGQLAGNLWGTSSSGSSTIGDPGTLPAAFPKGYAAFYMMKYSITQQQYVDFLNTLTRAQQNNRTETDLAAGVTSVNNRYVMSNMSSNTSIKRNGIRVDANIHTSNPITFYCDLSGNGIGGEDDDGQWIAMNWMSWMDGAAYMDWSGLRPFTELEYEKAARGFAAPVADEYAWGSTSITAYTGISNAGLNNETASNADANAVFGNSGQFFGQGPLRVGAFAKLGTTREQAGASYWGIMELSGNLMERLVTVGNVAGRSFTGLHGNGELNSAGAADVNHWPGINGNNQTGTPNGEYDITTGEGVTQTAGSGGRGGSGGNLASEINVSNRFAATSANPNRFFSNGFRGVRSAPAAGGGE